MTGLGRLAEALFHRREIFARDVAALDLVEELVARTALAGDDRHLDPAELARSARLLLVGVVDVDLLREIFAIGDLRRAHIGLDLELALHAVDQDFEVERSEEHTSELQSLMRISYAVFCLKKKNNE